MKTIADAAAALQRGDGAGAEARVAPLLEHSLPAVRAAALAVSGRAAVATGRPAVAVRRLMASVRLDANRAEAWSALAELFVQFDAVGEARQALAQVARLRPQDPAPWLRGAELAEGRGQLLLAAQALGEAAARRPGDPSLRLRQAQALLGAGQLEAAAAVARSVTEAVPTGAGAWALLGDILHQMGEVDAAAAAFDRAVAAAPTSVPGRVNRAMFRLFQRDTVGASQDAEAVIDSGGDHPAARFVLGRVARMDGRLEDALGELDAVLAHPGAALRVRGAGHVDRGMVRERLGDFPGAAADFAAGQRCLAQLPAAQAYDGAGYLAAVADIRGTLPRCAAASWPQVPPAGVPLAGAPPIFLFGFPRSGTTLAERVLAAHPSVVPTDERNLLASVLGPVRERPGGYPESVLHLDDADLVALRGCFAAAARDLGAGDGERVLDKLPLNLVHIALVRRVFPDAPVIVMLRDPRDCVWSAFTQDLVPNHAMVLTATLDGTARLYAAVMGLWCEARQLPGLNATTVRYEELVGDLEGAARTLVAAGGLPWDDRVLDYRNAIGAAHIRTPSFHAVSKPVTTVRVGRWRRFAGEMSAVLPMLEPFVDAFGYDRSTDPSP